MIASYNDLDEDVVVRHGVGMWSVFYANETNLTLGPVFACEAMAYVPGAAAVRVFVAGAKEAQVFVLGAQEAR